MQEVSAAALPSSPHVPAPGALMPKCHCPDSCEEPAEPLSTHRDRPGTASRLSRADGSAETAVADPWAGLIPPEGSAPPLRVGWGRGGDPSGSLRAAAALRPPPLRHHAGLTEPAPAAAGGRAEEEGAAAAARL